MNFPNITIGIMCRFCDRMSIFKRRIILLAMGLFSALSFAPVYFFPSYMIAMPILLVLIIGSHNSKEAFKCGYVFGIGHFFAGLYWIGNSFAVEPDVPDWAGYIVVLVLAACLSIFTGLVGWGVKKIHFNHSFKTHLVNIVISFSVIWCVAEWMRGYLFTGFPWNLTGYILGFSDIMLQSTAVFGVFGLSLVTTLLCFVPFMLIERNLRIYTAFCFSIVLVCMYLYGNNRLSVDTQYVEDVNLRIVQANIKQQDKWPYQNWGKNLITHMEMSEGDDKPGTTHIIWPETAVIYSLSEEPVRRQLISQILKEGGNVLTGFPRRERREGGMRIYNSLITINDEGEVAGIYDKSHLVPFGEYIPAWLRSVLIPLGLDQILTGGQGFSEGDKVETLRIEGLPPVGVLICYEVIFPGQVVDQENRPDWLLNITNDAWYGNSSGPRQHLLQTRVRAIEEGLPIVRSASTGISALIDPYGRILHKVPLNKRGVINSELPSKIATTTFYSRYNDWIFACISVMLIIVNIVLWRRKPVGAR